MWIKNLAQMMRHETDYDSFTIYIDKFSLNGFAIVHDKDENKYHVCIVTRIFVGADVQVEHEGDYCGEFVTDDNIYFLCVECIDKG